jgi:hypothetical protein
VCYLCLKTRVAAKYLCLKEGKAKGIAEMEERHRRRKTPLVNRTKSIAKTKISNGNYFLLKFSSSCHTYSA